MCKKEDRASVLNCGTLNNHFFFLNESLCLFLHHFLHHRQMKNRDLGKNKNKPMMNFNKANSEECKYYCMNLDRRRKNVLKNDYIQNDKNISIMYGKMLPMIKKKPLSPNFLTCLVSGNHVTILPKISQCLPNAFGTKPKILSRTCKVLGSGSC